MDYESDLNLKATELRLGLPGRDEPENQWPPILKNNKRVSAESSESSTTKSNSIVSNAETCHRDSAPPAKVKVVGWPPIRSYRKNNISQKKLDAEAGGMYVKVSLDGAPYLRKIDLKVCKSYQNLLKALEDLFKLAIGEYSEKEGYKESDYAPTYQDKDGDWMLVGDVPWDMFTSSCKKLRIMKRSEARGLGCF
ncbi:AUX_IAA domain-containing protein [Cephalotus follicularis]|uniref:Auxin-responsive protein n=1 Tax=Cephalotus follicularis TaxID=3775 RepID=A0A1Q3BZX1_CEPFO|nr:AUX_IAA domain-containing protein [Cephalotus follicularis]